MNHLLAEGINLTLFGMGSVFVFLILLVFATGLMSALVARYAPDPKPADTVNPNVSPANQVDDPQLLAVITAAIHQHRLRHK